MCKRYAVKCLISGNCFITYCLLIGNNVGRSPKFFLVFLFDGLAFLILSSSRSIQIYPSFLLTPTRRAFTADPLVRLHPDLARSRRQPTGPHGGEDFRRSDEVGSSARRDLCMFPAKTLVRVCIFKNGHRNYGDVHLS